MEVVKESTADLEGSSDFADDSFSSDEDLGEPEATKNESEDNVEPDEDPNKGWADAMAKILNKKIPDKAGTILVKSKALEKEKARERLEKLEKRKERTIVIENYGTLNIMVPGSLWASRASFSFGFDNGEPTLQVFPGQDSPIPHIRESRTLIWASQPEEELLQSSRSNENPDRNGSTSDQNQAEPESVQTPPCNQESDELPECSVCLLEIEKEDKSSRLPCSHQFHDECITRWMEQSGTCPYCRARVNHHIWSAFDVPNYGRMAVIIPGLLSSLQPPVRMDFDREALTIRIHTPTRDE